DLTVTGVQTCALPISATGTASGSCSPMSPSWLWSASRSRLYNERVTTPFTIGLVQDRASADAADNLARTETRIREAAGRGAQIRSEERRVGKGCGPGS